MIPGVKVVVWFGLCGTAPLLGLGHNQRRGGGVKSRAHSIGQRAESRAIGEHGDKELAPFAPGQYNMCSSEVAVLTAPVEVQVELGTAR